MGHSFEHLRDGEVWMSMGEDGDKFTPSGFTSYADEKTALDVFYGQDTFNASVITDVKPVDGEPVVRLRHYKRDGKPYQCKFEQGFEHVD